jgi:dual specificity phosphatase 3
MADFSQITGRLFVGGQINDGDWPALKAAGITHVLDAQLEREDRAPADEDIFALWVPQPDDGKHPKPVSWFRYAVAFGLWALTNPNARLLTHCAAGVNRGPSLGYAVMRAQGWSREDAFALLKKNRPQVNVAYRDDADIALQTLEYVK